MKAATLLLAWLVLIPIGIIVPQTADAAEPEPPSRLEQVAGLLAELDDRDDRVPDIEFGQRLTRGSTMLASKAAASSALPLPTQPELERPDFQIWPDDDLNQVVNLESFLMITDGFESQSWCWCFWFFNAYFNATPLSSTFEFRESDTGARDTVECLGPGAPWFFGLTEAHFPWCGKDWDHSSDVTGEVEVKARVNHLIVVTGSINLIYPAQSRASDTEMLDVGEVQSVGQTIAVPVTEPPVSSDSGGFCSAWGISVVCWIGEQAADLALEAILAAAPFLEEVMNFFEGCADAAIDAAGGLVDILRELKDAVTNPREFIDEKVQEFKDLIEAIEEDPQAFAEEVLGDLARLDTLDEEGVAQWLGEIICMLAIEYFTGKAADTIISAARTWLKNRRNNPDGPDPDRPPDPDCVLSSFPGATQVLMADGSYERIDDIRPGDWVLSHDLDTSVWEPKQVLDQWSHLDRGPPALATLANDATIAATDDHRFWVDDAQSWIELQDLAPGDQLLTPDGHVAVTDVLVGTARDWLVWELTVADNHNFTVRAGDADLLVHNYNCQPNPRQLQERTQQTADRLAQDGLQVTPEEVAQAWQRYLQDHPDADFDTWQGQYENIRRNNHLGNAHEAEILSQYPGDLGKNGQTFPDPDGGGDFKPDAVLSTDPPHFVEIKDYQNTVLYPGSNAGKQLRYITEHARDTGNPGTFDLHITDPDNISPGMQDLIDDARDAGVTVRINPDPS